MAYNGISNQLYQTLAATNATANTWAQASYGQQLSSGYPPPPTWYTFGCGHQIKLEQGQPPPTLCEKCGPVQYETFTYKKCGHAYSYQKGQQVPPSCRTCAIEVGAAKREEEAAAAAVLAAEKKRREDDKDLRVWLDREVSRVLVPA